KNNTTNPAVDTVQAGQAVRWTSSSGSHTVRSQGVPSFTSSGTINQNGTYLVTFNTTGTYQYDCSIHGGLPGGRAGTVVVIPSPPAAPPPLATARPPAPRAGGRSASGGSHGRPKAGPVLGRRLGDPRRLPPQLCSQQLRHPVRGGGAMV